MIDDRVQLNVRDLYNDVEFDQINHANENDGNLCKLGCLHDWWTKDNFWLEVSNEIQKGKFLLMRNESLHRRRSSEILFLCEMKKISENEWLRSVSVGHLFLL